MTLYTVKDLRRRYPKIDRAQVDRVRRLSQPGDEPPTVGEPDTDVYIAWGRLRPDDRARLDLELTEKRFTYLAETDDRDGGLMTRRMKRCRGLLLVATAHQKLTHAEAWLAGYFDGLRAKVALLPILRRDTSDLHFHPPAELDRYPYVAYGDVYDPFGESRTETLWVLKDTRTYVDLEHWLIKQGDIWPAPR